MNNQNLRVLWTTLGAICFYITINMWSKSQGGSVLFPGVLIDDRPIPGSYLAVFVVAMLLFLVVRIGREYLKGKQQQYWTLRFPVVGLEDLLPKDGLTRWYQGVFLFAFVILPAISLVHFCDKVITHGDIADKQSAEVYKGEIFYISDLKQLFSLENYKNNYCMGQGLQPTKLFKLCNKDDDNNYEGGVTWFPLISPLAMLLVSALSIFYALTYLIDVFRRPKR